LKITFRNKKTPKWINDLAKSIAMRIRLYRDRWYHIAMVRQAKKYVIYRDGIPALTTDELLALPDSKNWTFGDGDFTVDFWIRIKTFNPKTWTTAQHFAFAQHFRRVA
jgi:hypothetical protein